MVDTTFHQPNVKHPTNQKIVNVHHSSVHSTTASETETTTKTAPGTITRTTSEKSSDKNVCYEFLNRDVIKMKNHEEDYETHGYNDNIDHDKTNSHQKNHLYHNLDVSEQRFDKVVSSSSPSAPVASWMSGTWGVGFRIPAGGTEPPVIDNRIIPNFRVRDLVRQVQSTRASWVIVNLSAGAFGDRYISYHPILQSINPGSTPPGPLPDNDDNDNNSNSNSNSNNNNNNDDDGDDDEYNKLIQ